MKSYLRATCSCTGITAVLTTVKQLKVSAIYEVRAAVPLVQASCVQYSSVRASEGFCFQACVRVRVFCSFFFSFWVLVRAAQQRKEISSSWPPHRLAPALYLLLLPRPLLSSHPPILHLVNFCFCSFFSRSAMKKMHNTKCKFKTKFILPSMFMRASKLSY